ncbi:MAG: SMI1/KNR4 family protein [Kurthia sp.]
MDQYELVKENILKYPDELEYFSNVSSELVAKFEKELNIELKGSYKKFLLDFGYLSFGALEIFGIPHKKLLKQNEDYTNALAYTIESRNEINLSENLIVIYNFGNGELYCLDLSTDIPKVVSIWDERPEGDQNPPITEVIAESFEDFLKEYVNVEIKDFM